jgi:heavy metal efflux system protein
MNALYTKYKSPILVVLLLILFGGVYSLQKIKSDLFPNITFPKIKIIAENGEQPVDKMMVTVTIPLEDAIKKVQDLNLIRSITSRGSCEISAFLNWGSDVDLGKQRVEARINEIRNELPPDVSITIEKMNPSILPVMGFSLEGNGLSQIELRQIAEYTVRPFLSRIQGVSEVAVIGGKVKEFQILLDPQKMSRLGLTPQIVGSALAQSNVIASNGYVKDYNRLYLSVTDASIKTKKELENTSILTSEKRNIRVKDFARVKIGERKEYIKIKANGKNVPLIAVLKQPDVNLLEVVKDVKSQLGNLQKILPHGVKLVPYYDQADFVSDAIGSLKDVVWIGLLLSIVVTIFFLRSLKASSVILLTIPATLGLTLTVMLVLGYTFNIMTIGAIAAAIGLIIDDAIVVVEQIHRTHEEHPDAASIELVGKAVGYLFPAMAGSSLSTIVIFLPFALMSGVAGAYFKVMTNTMIITLTCSFFVTWIGLPVIYLFVSKGQSFERNAPIEKKGKTWIDFFIHRPAISLIFVIVLIIVSLIILPRLPSGFLPDMDEGSIVLDYTSPPGTSLEDTDDMLNIVDSILNTTPEVESYSRRTGTQMGFYITEQNTGDYLIQLKKHRSKTTDEVSDDIRKRIEAMLPSLRVDFGQVITDMLGDLMTSVQPIEIKIFGDNQEQLKKVADQVADVVGDVPGTADVFDGITIAGPSIYFDPKASALLKYHLSPQDFQYQMQTKMDGEIVGTILEPNQVVDIRMMESPRNPSLLDLERTRIFLPDGMLKPIDEFTGVKILPGAAEIDRENLKPMIAVTARLSGRDLGSVLRDIQKSISEKIKLPAGMEIVYGGTYAQQQSAFRELLIILLLALLLVFTVILFLFRRVRVALAIICIAVLGLAGSVIALFVTGTPLNVGSYTGIIMIVGIIGENAIFTYLQYNEARKEGKNVDDAIVYSISLRLRPKLMTALCAITALSPLAFGIGTGAQLHQPLAIAIIGGLLFGLPLLLIVLPTLLSKIEQ